MNGKVLTIDIGNSNTKFGIFANGRLQSTYKVKSDPLNLTKIKNFLENMPPIEACVYSSVKPSFEEKLIQLLKGFCPFYKLSAKTAKHVKISYKNPQKLGADRIVKAYFVQKYVIKDSVIVDIGTAITIDFIQKNAEFLGGFILPGPETSIKALLDTTELLKPLKIVKQSPQKIGKDTEECILSGVLNGLRGGILYLVKLGSRETGFVNPRKIVTGGAANLLNLKGFKKFPHLTLLGLYAFWEHLSHEKTRNP